VDGHRIRIVVQLIDARTDAHLWAETYDRGLADIFAVQSDVARQVAAKLAASLSVEDGTPETDRPTTNLEAYDRYLRANDINNAADDERSLMACARLYGDAVALDPTFAQAWARLSETHARIWSERHDPSADRRRLAKDAIDRAVALQRDLPEVHRGLGLYYDKIDSDYDRAIEEFRITRKGRPSDSAAAVFEGYVKRRQGRFEESLADQFVGMELDPRAAYIPVDVAFTYGYLRRVAEADRY
jgi:tetratricopeptide (TPR) repeat protein